MCIKQIFPASPDPLIWGGVLRNGWYMLNKSDRKIFYEKHDKILKDRAERKKAAEEKKKKEALLKKQRQEKIERMSRVTVIVMAAGYCKRAPASITQAKTYLKKVKLYKKREVEYLTEENVVEEFLKLCRARSRQVIAKMKQEAAVKKEKPRKRKRVEPKAPRKKPKVVDIKAEEDSGDPTAIIQVKKEPVI